MVVTKFSARVAKIKYSSSAITFDTTALLDAETTTATVASVKNITISIPKSELEQMPLLGETGKTVGVGIPNTATSQNAFLDEKAYGLCVVTGTMVLRGDEDFEAMIVGAGTSVTGGTRYTFGDSASGKKRVTDGALIIDLDNGSEVVTFALANILMNFGELKPTGADGHFELDFEGTCLPENFAWEYKDQMETKKEDKDKKGPTAVYIKYRKDGTPYAVVIAGDFPISKCEEWERDCKANFSGC